jgi:FkbM family methyltransferase
MATALGCSCWTIWISSFRTNPTIGRFPCWCEHARRPVIAFEANPLHQKKLEGVRSRNPERFRYHIGAVTDAAKGDMTLFTPFWKAMAMHSASALSRSEALAGVEGAFPSLAGQFSARETTTPTLAIDSLGLDFSLVKIDIQGEELRALQGMSETIGRCRPAILVEMNLMQGGIAEFMRGRGYEPYTYDAVKGKLIPGYGPHTVQHRNQFFLPEGFAKEFA